MPSREFWQYYKTFLVIVATFLALLLVVIVMAYIFGETKEERLIKKQYIIEKEKAKNCSCEK